MGWGEVGWGGVRGGKNPGLGYPMSSHDTHTVANDTPVGTNPGPHDPIGAIFPVVNLEGWQNALQESRPVNM